jgi:hypothetical protein
VTYLGFTKDYYHAPTFIGAAAKPFPGYSLQPGAARNDIVVAIQGELYRLAYFQLVNTSAYAFWFHVVYVKNGGSLTRSQAWILTLALCFTYTTSLRCLITIE